jgi:trehalose/maltose transport system permease protein
VVGGLARSQRRWAVVFLLPMLLALGGAAGWPLLRTAMLSLTDAGLSTEGARFVGLENYLSYGPDPAAYDAGLGGYYVLDVARDADLVWRPGSDSYFNADTGQPAPAPAENTLFAWRGVLTQPAWWRAVGVTLGLAVTSVLLETVLGVAMALFLARPMRGRALLRASLLVPWAIPTVVGAQLWNWMLNDQYGVLNAVLIGLGLIPRGIAWTAEPGLSLLAILVADVWKTTPFIALLALAALHLVPEAVREAARVDGVGCWGMLRHITLPLIAPAVLVAVMFRAIDALRLFDLVFVMTGNSPNTATMSIYARQQMVDFQRLGFGSAASMVLVAIVALVAAVLLTLGRRRGAVL